MRQACNMHNNRATKKARCHSGSACGTTLATCHSERNESHNVDGANDSTRAHAENGRTYGESVPVRETSGMLCARDYCRRNVRQFQTVQGVATVCCAVLGPPDGTKRALRSVAAAGVVPV